MCALNLVVICCCNFFSSVAIARDVERAREKIALIVHNVQSSIIKYIHMHWLRWRNWLAAVAKIAMNYCYAIHSGRVADARFSEGGGNFV